MCREYVSTEFNCRRISVIVHRSASDKLAVDSLVLLVLLTEFYSPKERETGAPNDCFLLNTLKALLRLSRVFLDL